MPCGRGQSYVVNPDNKRDNSFKLFITFLLAVLFVYLVIYALIVILTKQRNYGKENEKPIIKSSATIFSLLYQKDNLNISEESTEASNDEEQLYTTRTGNNEDSTEEPIELESATTENEISTLSTNKQTSTAEENPILLAIESTYLAATKLVLTSTTDKAITEESCQSPNCKKTAIDIMKNIDFSIDPCEDFYQFSCGNEAKSSNSEDFDVLFEEIENPKDDGVRSFGRFFNSCLDYTKQFDTIKQILSINVRSSNMTTLLGFLLLRQSTPLFEIVEGSNGEIQILPPSSYDTDILENWSLKTHINKHCLTSRNLDDYKQCQSKTLNKMLKNLHLFKNNEKPMGDDFVLNIIKQQISNIDIQEALFKKSCQQVDIPQLNKDYPIINWQILLNTISETQNSICIYFKSDYFDPIMSDLKSKNESEVLNSIKDYFQLQLYENLMSQRNSKFCMKQAVELMPEIAEKIFQKYVVNNSKRFERMFEEVKDKFSWLIEVSKLKEDDKSLLQNKLKLLKIEYNTKKFAPEDYHDANDDYLTKLFMLLEAKRMIHKEKKTILFKKIDLVNDTIIGIPYSFIHKTSTRPDFYIKFHISRAIAKYFHQQNINNSFYQEFQKSLNTNLENKLDGGLLKVNENWSKLVPASTLERTVDNLALQVAFESYFAGNVSTRKLPWISEVYTDQQQFFLGIGQDICESSLSQPQIIEETKNLPPKFRLDAMLTNSQNFAKSFSCPEGSTMNPADEKIEFDQFEFDEEYDFIE